MYVPSHFQETRVEVLHELIRGCPFGALITLNPGGIEANHIPLVLDPEAGHFGTLRGHVARGNPVWRETRPEFEAMVIFQGPDA